MQTYILIEALMRVAVLCVVKWFTGLPVAQTDQEQTHILHT